MTSDQKKAYEWAKNQNYPSVAARYAKELAGLVDELQVASCARQEQERNAPLTLDDLRKMDGEPVWIKLFDPDEEFWVLRNEWVDTQNPEPMILFHMRWYSHVDYGKTWLAYRSKPEEDSSND